MSAPIRLPRFACLTLFLAAVSLLVPAVAAEQLYLVKFKATEAGAPTNKEQAIALLDGLIVPTLSKLSQDPRVVAGGLHVGAREGSFIVRAASNEAVTTLVRDLPAWGVWDWQVVPLESFAHRAAIEAQNVKALKTQ